LLATKIISLKFPIKSKTYSPIEEPAPKESLLSANHPPTESPPKAKHDRGEKAKHARREKSPSKAR